MDGMCGADAQSPIRTPTSGPGYLEAEAMPGVFAVRTHEDVPGRKVYGMEIPTSPCSRGRGSFPGEPVAVVAADHQRPPGWRCEKISGSTKSSTPS